MSNDAEKLIAAEMKMRDEISGKDHLGYNMFVEAGAGAGKTYTIVQRVLNQLDCGERSLKPGQIVVITFTNKAAEELRGRISSGLQERLNDPKYTGDRDKLRNVLYSIDDMNISTIHSFCFKLLKERCFDAALPMDLVLLDNDATKEQAGEIFQKWVASLKYSDWRKLRDADPNNKRRSAIIREIRKIYDDVFFIPKEKKVHIDCGTLGDDDKRRLYEGLEKVITNGVMNLAPGSNVSCFEDIYTVEEINGFLGSLIVPKEKVIITAPDGKPDYAAFFRAFVSMVEGSSENNKDKVGYKLYKPTGSNPFKTGGTKSDVRAKISALNDAIRKYISDNQDAVNEVLNGPIVEYRNLVNMYAQKAKDYYARICMIDRLTNDALLEKTRDMILASDEAQQYFSEKYKCYYVDEFQDTDNIQESFIWRLASKPGNVNELRDGALFIVGDPKQSIYRFRGAEPDVYMQVKKRMKAMQDKGGNAKVYELQINFRSNDLIIKWVNEKFSATTGFSPIMVPKNGISFSYQNMIARNALPPEMTDPLRPSDYGMPVYSKKKPLTLAGVYKYMNPEKNLGTDPPGLIEALNERREKTKCGEDEIPLQDLTDLILNLCDNDEYKIMRNGKPDKIRFDDFMILCMSKTNMNAYLEYMSLRGIPIQIAGSTDPKAIMEINAFVRIYSYIANRKSQTDRVAAIEAFRCLGVTDKENDLDKYALNMCDHIFRECKGMSAYAMALYMVDHLSVILKKNRGFSEFEIRSLQAKIVQMIETVCRDNYGTAKDIAIKLKEYLNKTIEHELSLEERTNAVRFMNIHKSKGLQGNIVIIVDRRGKNFTVSSFMEDNEYYPRAKMYPDLMEKEKKELMSEARRLEYVAATRAAQVLIFMDQLSTKTLFGGEENTQYDLSELPSIGPVIFDKPPHGLSDKFDTEYDPKDEDNEHISRTSSLDPEKLLPDCQRVSPSKFESGKSPTKNRAIRRLHQEKKEHPERDVFKIEPAGIARPEGNILGTTMHRALELLVDRYKAITGLSDDAVRKNMIRACAFQAVAENRVELSEEEREDYKVFLTAVLKAYYDKLKELGWLDEDGVSYHTELPFSYYENDTKEGDNQLFHANKHLLPSKRLKEAPVWMNGSADLVIRKKPGTSDETIMVIDYKSDNDRFLNEADYHTSMSEKYLGQLDNYCYAMRKLFGVPRERISMSVVSFSQNDGNGTVYKDDTIRVRVTKIDENVATSSQKEKASEKEKEEMAFTCNNCGESFDDPVVDKELMGEYWGAPAYKITEWYCPFCGSKDIDGDFDEPDGDEPI